MAKFNEKHLKLKDNQRVYFGDSDDSSLWFDGSEMRIATTISGVDPTEEYHLATKKYVDDTEAGAIDHGDLTGLGDDDHTQYHNDTRGDARYYTKTLLDAGQLDSRYFTETEHIDSSAGAGDSGKPIKLDAGGHVDATMINDADVDHANLTNTHNLTTDIDHGSIAGLGDDDHTIYSKADGTRAFTGTVGGVTPVADADLATKGYVDDKTKTGRTVLANNDSSKSVIFSTAFSDTNYSLSVMMRNIVDSSPSIYPMIVTATTVSGFGVLFSGDIDSANYYLDWIAQHD